MCSNWPWSILGYHHDWSPVITNAGFSQYYANGEAWCLPPGAHETIVILKDAGGYVYEILS